MTDVFAEVRRLVSAREVAERHSLYPNRSGFVCCPFHNEKTPSLKLYPNGTWHCFGCNRGGSSIDFVMELYGLAPLEAVRRLNEDFHLALPLDKPPDKAEQVAIQRKKEINDTYQLFQKWRNDLTQQLNTCILQGHIAMKSLTGPEDYDRLTAPQTLAIQEQDHLECLADTLTGGTMAEQIEIFRERGQIQHLCTKILSSTPMKSDAT